MALEAADVIVHLRKRRVTVHHAVVSPVLPGRRVVVVFLEGNLGQHEDARRAALMLNGVAFVRFSGRCRSVMYVAGHP
jgi:hypothetical protein